MNLGWRHGLVGLAVLLLLLAAVGGGPQVGTDSEPPDRATLTFLDETGAELGTVDATIAEGFFERYTGLSETDRLGPDAGMVFVYPEAGERTFVMRNMSFSLDIVFVGADGEITAIHHAAAEDDREFSGEARWVIEVNRGYTDAHEIEVGDSITGLPR
ncbi:DUF192 domain-containing protein [Halodesulfurarchaeum sp. HSR-GB]|uniref:DUF192 domain-containing protein n=1 Tax=Halodesulfurarchaeum sp. HSR-GB TaxID=3074077 RepID=UPI00286747C5|nr:DUF192 domain-containing protein [Halodesulfurarchaeum sp. HSR-GB]MDR5656468.1 DUF192 domain-containing protein [Halodesulfurarchaeum sp. HSR-GB]